VYQHDHAPTHTARLVTEGFDEDESDVEHAQSPEGTSAYQCLQCWSSQQG